MLKNALLTAMLAFSAFSLSGCAGTGAGKSGGSLSVAPGERLLLEIAPFDPVVSAELTRGGLDPARVAEDFEAELRYQFALRKQEEALDSAGATVRLRVELRHLQPGSGNAGAFASIRLAALRADDSAASAWEWRPLARENVPQTHAGRHLVRSLSKEVIAHLKEAARKDPSGMDYPPPLILLK